MRGILPGIPMDCDLIQRTHVLGCWALASQHHPVASELGAVFSGRDGQLEPRVWGLPWGGKLSCWSSALWDELGPSGVKCPVIRSLGSPSSHPCALSNVFGDGLPASDLQIQL